MEMNLSSFFIFLSWLLCLFSVGFYYGGEEGERKIVVIENGLSGREISYILEEEGIVPSFLFRLFLLSNQDKLIAGNYFYTPVTVGGS